MNLILFQPSEVDDPLPRNDRRAKHIVAVLGRKPGDTFDVGLVNGPRGRATLVAITATALALAFTWGPAPPALDPITLIVGLARPQTARDILREATTLGVSAIHFVRTEKSEPSYAQSTLWSSGEWHRHVCFGAEQAFDTRLPDITHGRTLGDIVATLAADDVRLALDNYEAAIPLSACRGEPGRAHVLALGAERGWSGRERQELRAEGFTLVRLGARVLRTETAAIAALAILRSKLGLM